MKYKLFVSDFDGTIYRDDHTVSKSTIDAFAAYIKSGGKVAIATGRLYAAITKHLADMGLEGYVIVYQGAGIYDIKTGERVYHMPVDGQVAVDVLTSLQKEDDCVPMFFYEDVCYMQHHNIYSQNFAKIVGVELVATQCPTAEYITKNNIIPSKVLALTKEELSLSLADKMRKLFSEKLNINRSSKALVEFVNINASKGNAVKWLGEKLGISREETVAIGDAENDISMVAYAGLGLAVENAMTNLKKVAVAVVPSNDNDGVAYAINHFCLNNAKNKGI